MTCECFAVLCCVWSCTRHAATGVTPLCVVHWGEWQSLVAFPLCKLHVVAAYHSNLCQWMLHGVQSPDLQQLTLMVFFIPATSW